MSDPLMSTGYLLHHVAALLAKQSEQVLQEQLGIGMSQFKILRILEAEPRTTQKEIAFHLGQTEASISRQVKLMMADGLLQTIISPKDHREHLTVLTHKGMRLNEAALQALARYHRPTFDALSDKQREQLAVALETIHQHLCTSPHPDFSAHNKQ